MAGKTSLKGKLLCFFEEMGMFCFQYHGYLEVIMEANVVVRWGGSWGVK